VDDPQPLLKERNQKAYLVHRLDKATSRLLLVALTPSVATALGALFQQRQIQKTYWAVCVGALPHREGKHEMWMAKRPGRQGEKMEAVFAETVGALDAICTYRDLGQEGELSLWSCIPKRGVPTSCAFKWPPWVALF
jgi:23S rRNA-/tRNA-specific pseudouridylate synthase